MKDTQTDNLCTGYSKSSNVTGYADSSSSEVTVVWVNPQSSLVCKYLKMIL